MSSETYDVVVIGAGQAGLASAYYLRRAGVDFILLDDEEGPGGTWRHAWDSLRLFSPASFSSLPGWMMPTKTDTTYPAREDVIDYLARYEKRYQFRIERPVFVTAVSRSDEGLRVLSDNGEWRARAVLSATGTWRHPLIPDYPGRADFMGHQIHSANYVSAEAYSGKRVAIVGGGNSGAQILSEISTVAETIWVTPEPPVFLPDDVDGHVLFQRATARVLGTADDAQRGGLGDIVMVPPVKDARSRGVLGSVRPFTRFDERGVIWRDGTRNDLDAIVWCTGFRPALDHLRDLDVINEEGKVDVDGGQSVKEPRLWLSGYGNWTGAASATLLGAGRAARDMIPQLVASLK
ncbi:ArsO family NAD(P)H-dependent flavin-containing monooxygenase [Shinella sp. NM-101]|uniref:ArsO family NAD(P)H-dependent flavin-containing monooxygenase n=1 Tax=Shinella sp. NM-101 TaxID=2744455 RepID=UPI00351DA7AF